MDPVLSRISAALADRYRVERELGSGGTALVFLAEDLSELLAAPGILSPALLKVDPAWDPLRDEAAFERLVAGPSRD